MIIIIGPFPDPIDGCSFANFILASNFKKNDIPFKIINTNVKKVSSTQGNKFSLFKMLLFLKSYKGILKILFASKIYITPGQTFYGIIKYSPFIILAYFLKVPYVIHLHGNYLGKEYISLKGIKKKLFTFLVSNASAGIVLSNSLRGNFNNLIPDSRVYVVYNFVEKDILSTFSSINSKPKDFLRILFLSNLIEEKGIIDFLNACVILKLKQIPFKATVAGAFDNAVRVKVNSLFSQLDQSLDYLGVINGNDKLNAFINSNVFILPTYYKMEGQPISLLEGLAAKNIIITTNHAGIPDIISSKNGFLVNPKSPQQIADILTDISYNLSDYLDKYSKFNFEYAESNFSEEIFTSKVLNVIENVR
ncbi:glycosyltransferase family 4 protein [uncultured Algoriphagus sp.]|uniref:glycosyltransferase family 4 protein n=1 Tax=uncultured Algoriphagus sp. TaxID=417365 RepID=UPI0030EC0A9D|tara:strand:+ start:1952 stop:3040 length:1089 start_codon:yes stop_codon:yes gene_type:complete